MLSLFKSSTSYIVLISALSFLGSCIVNHYDSNYQDFPSNDSIIQTKSYYDFLDPEYYTLKETDLHNFVRFRELEGLSQNNPVSLQEIIPIQWENVNCLYVIQYEDGFEIISADKRSPIPIAIHKSGFFNKSEEIEGFRAHLDLLAEEIWFSLHGELDITEPEILRKIESSLDFWSIVNSEVATIQRYKDNTKGHFFPDPMLPLGHWELVDVESEEIVYDSIPHLITSRWAQDGIYNLFCPDDINQNNDTVRCPAGCVAIAGAQMLYFLHYETGVPVSSPTTGYCITHFSPRHWNQIFDNYSTNTWNLMTSSSSTDTLAALLIGDVGKKLRMDYQWDGSEADTEDLVDDVFAPYGLDCSYIDHYDPIVITSSLISHYPVVCAGRRQTNEGKVGHAFLVDSYKRYRTKTTLHYEWVCDDPNGPVITDYQQEITYSSPHISYYQMNWGYGPDSNNDIWCSLSGIWQYGDRTPYTYHQRMIYNFTID